MSRMAVAGAEPERARTLESAPELDLASGSILPQRESEPWTSPASSSLCSPSGSWAAGWRS